MSIRPRRTAPAVAPLPHWVMAGAVLGLAFMVVPILLMSARVPWADLPAHLGAPASRDALWLSLRTSIVAVGIDILIGVPLAVTLAKGFPGVRAVRVAVALPLALPPVVAGMALISTFGRKGAIGGLLESVGLGITFTTTAVIIAQVFVSLPFLVVTLEAALRARPDGLEQTAAALGAGPTRVFWQITMPMVLPALARGTALALARCLGEFGATLTFAGSRRGVTRTMPLEIYLAREDGQDTALALGMLLILMAIGVVALTEWPERRRRPAVPDEPLTRTVSVRADSPAPSSTRATPAPVRVDGRIDARDWQVDIELPGGQVSAVMGHNGAGKSTLAEVLGGSLRMDSGTVLIGSTVVEGGDVFVPANRRGVTVLSQDPRVFGHMSVLDNVTFPLRCRGVPGRLAREKAMDELALVGCAHLSARRGDELSGGQAARVALARALVANPHLLVLDEPTAALDVEATAQVSRVLSARLRDSSTTTLLVTHDLAEAIQLAHHMVVLEGGQVVEQGSPTEVVAAPRSTFAAHLAGLNVVTGELAEGPGDLSTLHVGDTPLVGCPPEPVDESGWMVADGAAARRAAMLFSPEAVALYSQPPTGSPRTVLRCLVKGIDIQAGLVGVNLELADGQHIRARVTAVAWADLGLGPGEEVWAQIKATQVRTIILPTRT